VKATLNFKAVAVMLAVAAVAGIGVAVAATDSGATRANTAGVGGSAPRVTSTLAIAVPTLVGAVTNGAIQSATVVGEVGSGGHQSLLVAVQQNAVNCFTATHADGAIVEALNCAQDAYLRVWDDASGSGEVDTSKASSQRVIALASGEVASVAFRFADGSSRTAKPDENGVAAVEIVAPESRVVAVTALDAGGQPLAEVAT
jgi:hypothetical protein